MANSILDRMFIKLSEMLDNSIKLAEVQLQNGSSLTQESEEFIIGDLIYVQDVEGNVVPAEVSMSYKAIDGTIYTTDENGALAFISAPEVVEEVEPVVEEGDQPGAEEVVEVIEAAEVEITVETPTEETVAEENSDAIHEAQMQSMIAAIGELMNRVESLEARVAELSGITTELSKQPAALSLSAIPQTNEKPLSREEVRIARLRAMAEQEKNKN